jgi:hypothetical protein
MELMKTLSVKKNWLKEAFILLKTFGIIMIRKLTEELMQAVKWLGN